MVNQKTPAEFTDALLTLRDAAYDSHVTVSEIAAPHGIAPFAAAIRMDCEALETNPHSGGSGRLVILYDPQEQPGWQGRFRLVTMLGAHASFFQAAGSVTRSHSASFGELEKRSESAEMELRASWTPLGNDLAPHAGAISRLLAMMSGYSVEVSAGISRLGQVKLV